MPVSVAWHLGGSVLCAFGWAVALYLYSRWLRDWLPARGWYPAALRHARAFCHSFGFPVGPQPPWFPEGVTDAIALEALIYIHWLLLTDGLPGLLSLPIAVLGWDAVGSLGQGAFTFATWLVLGHAFVDCPLTTVRTFAPDQFDQPRYPMPIWYMMCTLHHPFVVLLVLPLNRWFLPAWWYHSMFCALTLPTALTTVGRLYKMTLNLDVWGHRVQYTGIVWLTFALVVLSRGVLWAWCTFHGLSAVLAQWTTPFSIAASVATALMTLFNLIVVAEAAEAVVKCSLRPKTKAG